MDNFQGVIPDPSAAAVVPQGGFVVPSAVVEPIASADPSAAQQGGVQGAPEPTELDRAIQAGIDRVQARLLGEQYQLRQQLQQTQSQLNEVLTRQLQPQQQTNPFDPASQAEQYWDWKLQANNRSLLAEAKKSYRDEMLGLAQNAYEGQWAQQHPGVDIAQVRAFAEQHGIQQLDVAYTLMTLPGQFNQVRATTAQQVVGQYRQPQTQGAVSVRGTAATPNIEPQYKYEDLLRQLDADATLYDKWPEKLQKDFDRETSARQRLYRTV